LTQELQEEKVEEEVTIHPMDDEPNTPYQQPLTGGHLPFREMEITPPPKNQVMNVCNIKFDQQKKRIV